MNYENRRRKVGLSEYTVSKELGIDYQKYKEVERKQRNLEGDLVDAFQDVINRASEIKFNRMQRMRDIDDYFISKKGKSKLKEMNLSQSELSKELKYSMTTVNRVLNGHLSDYTDDIKERIYDYINDPMNIKIDWERAKEELPEKDLKIIEKMSDEMNELYEEVCEEELLGEFEDDIFKIPATTLSIDNTESLCEEDHKEKEDFVSDIYEKLIETRKENEVLKKQLLRYEKLIDRL